ncbi:recombinase family protein [Bradyrhizobium sp. CCBAU 51753]|uniref:recombinase family protein n=1 Tax=Bradyrhizobium sp. CCBAU 51753 TaxID=1325100 RepID=UPI00188C83B9|nr:recombinase family protein [Bradyrhizobium sp. CCBAU 51753]QOZ26711.1 recombinase family protein [Bradyrhizobium sp. CCBAU 51753]
MANALTVRREHLPTSDRARRAAQYVRMSTERQRYSVQNQAAVIAAYAHAHGLKIVRTYADEGESGLQIKNRAGIQQLIKDITTGQADYKHLLIYDVSRWGRFQDTDESAHYEFICKRAGVKIAYCAEQFENDGSMLSSIVKNLKRVMAAEYSRELGVKIHAGQCQLVRLGFSHGGPKPYGIQRLLVDKDSNPKGSLDDGENKNLVTDRVKLHPGTPQQIAIVNWIFQQCLHKKKDAEIARELNAAGVPNSKGRRWNEKSITRILHHEVYVGNLVYNRQSSRLKTPRISNPPELWVRNDGCIDPIIDIETFQRVQQLTCDRHIRISEEEMLTRLRRALQKNGRLSAAIVNATRGLPHMSTYINHFGSLRNAYRLIGYAGDRDYSFSDNRQLWDQTRHDLVKIVAARLERSGKRVRIAPKNDLLRVEGKDDVWFRVARSEANTNVMTRYYIRDMPKTSDRWLVVIRLTDDNMSVRDYVLAPTTGLIDPSRACGPRFTDYARKRLGFHTFKTPDALAKGIHRRLIA